MVAFLIAGLSAGIAGVLTTAWLNSGSPNYGAELGLQSIAAAVIGGASLSALRHVGYLDQRPDGGGRAERLNRHRRLPGRKSPWASSSSRRSAWTHVEKLQAQPRIFHQSGLNYYLD
jgi:hypothetical protein